MNRSRLAAIGQVAHPVIRVALSLLMIAFGMVKVIPTQFITFTLPTAMLVPLGDSSPSGMLWKFMATSTPYTVITGVVEVAGGLLLIFRRTTLVGALVCAVALTQVSILNIGYDVPVVLTPLVMLGMAIAVTLPWWRRLADVLVFDRDSPARPEPAADTRRIRLAGTGIHLAAALAVLAVMGANGIRTYGDYTERLSALDGVWAVDEFQGPGPRWVRLAIDDRPASQRLALTRATGEPVQRELVVDTAESTLRVGDWTLRYQYRGDTVQLGGEFEGGAVEVSLHRIPLRTESRVFR
ncbi:hypothetical protein [Nocardia sp. NPDC050406]|uniref:hypothetical protein n=1 Tax=Nocardia sp. NPDC050406 TaxID=3364318 RepID=UPI0037B9A889